MLRYLDLTWPKREQSTWYLLERQAWVVQQFNSPSKLLDEIARLLVLQRLQQPFLFPSSKRLQLLRFLKQQDQVSVELIRLAFHQQILLWSKMDPSFQSAQHWQLLSKSTSLQYCQPWNLHPNSRPQLQFKLQSASAESWPSLHSHRFRTRITSSDQQKF